MENNEILANVTVDSDYIQHWGIKGMRWGVRRYQNPDGSLTAAGKKRRAKLAAEINKLDNRDKNSKLIKDMSDDEIYKKLARMDLEKRLRDREAAERKELEGPDEPKVEKKVEKKVEPPKLKPISMMSDDEIRAKIDRIKLENSLRDLLKEPAKESPKVKDNSKKGKEVLNEILADSTKNIGKQTVTYAMGYGVNQVAKKIGHLNATKEILNNDGVKEIIEIYEDIVNPRKGQKDK